jgi:hypothetical protein
MSIATVDDVATELGRDVSEGSFEYKQIQKWLERAERLIRLRIPVFDEWCKDEDYKASVIDVESSAVSRKALNPEGVSSIMTQIDDANLQKTINSARSAGEVVLLDSEWELLLKTVHSDLESSVVAPDAVYVPLPHYPPTY